VPTPLSKNRGLLRFRLASDSSDSYRLGCFTKRMDLVLWLAAAFGRRKETKAFASHCSRSDTQQAPTPHLKRPFFPLSCLRSFPEPRSMEEAFWFRGARAKSYGTFEVNGLSFFYRFSSVLCFKDPRKLLHAATSAIDPPIAPSSPCDFSSHLYPLLLIPVEVVVALQTAEIRPGQTVFGGDTT